MIKNPIQTEKLPSLFEMDQLDTILVIVENAITYRKRLDELKKQRKELVKLISAIGTVNEIDTIKEHTVSVHEKVLAELHAAEDELNKAKELAKEIVADASSTAGTIQSDAGSRINDQKQSLDMREKALDEGRKQLNARENDLRKTEEKARRSELAITAEHDRLKQLQEAATVARMDYDELKRKLEIAIQGV